MIGLRPLSVLFGIACNMIADARRRQRSAASAALLHVVRSGSHLLGPARAFADATRLFYNNPLNPLANTPFGRSMSRPPASCSSAPRAATASRPSASTTTLVDGERVAVTERDRLGAAVLQADPFRSRAAARRGTAAQAADRGADVGPLCDAAARHGRGLPARPTRCTSPTGSTPAWCRSAEGRFDLDDYIDYVISMLHLLGPDMHVMAVCQPSVPVIAAVARMEAEDDPLRAALDDADGRADRHPRQPDRGQPARREARHRLVPPATASARCRCPIPGFMREVYPGFLQLSGFMAMNIDRHVDGPQRHVQAPGARATATRPRSTASSTTSIWRSWT